MSAREKPTIIRTSREIIEHRLLIALNDENKVALVLGKKELDIILKALEIAGNEGADEMIFDLRKLREESGLGG